MKVQELINMTMDTRVAIRDRATGKYLQEGYEDMEVCGVYAKYHECGNSPKKRTEMIIFARKKKTARKRSKWILIEERVPDNDRFILLSFANFSIPQVGRYHQDEDGDAFCVGDEEVPLASYGIIVNAWMELPECYRESEDE